MRGEIPDTVEQQDAGNGADGISIEHRSGIEVGYHLILTQEAGLIDGRSRTKLHGTDSRYWGDARSMREMHEFLNASRSEGTWDKAKAKSVKPGRG